MTNLADLKTVQCFFDPSHMILRSRVQTHYKKCCEQHRHIRHKLCPYNATHIMAPENYEDHLKTCDARLVLDIISKGAAEAIPPAPLGSWGEGEEGWVTETPAVPQKVQDKFIYTPIIGACKTVREEHRRKERLQYQLMENAKANEVQTSNNSKKKKKNKKSRNSKSNSENVDPAFDQKPSRNNASTTPLAVQKNSSSDFGQKPSRNNTTTTPLVEQKNSSSDFDQKPIRNNAGTTPLAEQKNSSSERKSTLSEQKSTLPKYKSTSPEVMNFAGLFLKK